MNKAIMKIEIPLDEPLDLIRFPGKKLLSHEIYDYLRLSVPEVLSKKDPVYLLIFHVPHHVDNLWRFNEYFEREGIHLRLIDEMSLVDVINNLENDIRMDESGEGQLYSKIENSFQRISLTSHNLENQMKQFGIRECTRLEVLNILSDYAVKGVRL